MTREERNFAIDVLKHLQSGDGSDIEEALSLAIQALKQECVIDMIKAEIKRFMYEINPNSSESDYACNYILGLIEQYRDKDLENTLPIQTIRKPCEELDFVQPHRKIPAKLNVTNISKHKSILDQESCENIISKESVYDAIQEWIEAGEYDVTNATYYLRKRIENLSSVQPIRSIEGLIKTIETDMSHYMYDDYGNTTIEHDVLVKIIKEYCGLEESNGHQN